MDLSTFVALRKVILSDVTREWIDPIFIIVLRVERRTTRCNTSSATHLVTGVTSVYRNNYINCNYI